MIFRVLLVMLTTVITVKANVHYVVPPLGLQQAIRTAFPGDTVILEDGIHGESGVLYGKCLTIGSRFLLDGDTNHIGATVVTPDLVRPDTASCFVYAYHEPRGSRLVGLTLRGGRGTYYPSAERTMGGGLYIQEAHLSVEYCRIAECAAAQAGGIWLVGFGDWETTSLHLSHSAIESCRAEAFGGAMWASRCSLFVNNAVIAWDTAEGLCGGLDVSISYVEIDSTIFMHCYGGTGALDPTDCFGYVRDCRFEHNATIIEYAGAHIFMTDCWLTISRCVFGETDLGSVALLIGGSNARYTFTGNVIENVVNTRRSGVIETDGRPRHEIGYNIFRNNTMTWGATIYAFAQCRARIHHNVFVNNISLHPDKGSVLYFISDARPTMDSNWIEGNSGQTITFAYNDTVHADCRNNWWGDATGPYHAQLNPGGSGDTIVQDRVLFEPWLTAPPDTSMPPNETPPLPRTVPHSWQLMGVYPNPFNGTARIQIAGFTLSDFRMTLHNILGQEVDEVHRGPLSGGELIYHAPPGLGTGVYFLHAVSRDRSETRKLVFLK